MQAEKDSYIYDTLENHPKVKSVRGSGFFLAFELNGSDAVEQVINKGVDPGFISNPFLFDNTRFRIAPPLTIVEAEIQESIEFVREALGSL